MDGTYESTLPVRLAAADAVIVVERSRWSCLWGVLRRTLTHGSGPRPDAPPGQPIDRAFLRYIWRYPARTTMVVLDGPKDITRLLRHCEAFTTSVESTRSESTAV
jgi:hypothetical protein